MNRPHDTFGDLVWLVDGILEAFDILDEIIRGRRLALEAFRGKDAD